MRITSNPYYPLQNNVQPKSPACTGARKFEGTAKTVDINFGGVSKVVLNRISNAIFNPMKKFKDFSLEEYSKLSPFELSILRTRYKCLEKTDYFYKNTEIMHDKLSDAIKTGLDKKYGENNYRVVVIGRSLSSIGKVLGYKIGEDRVINVPLSAVGSGYYSSRETIQSFEKGGAIKQFSDYLDTLGLSKDSVVNSKEKLVVMDYCCTGESLNGADNLFKYLYDDSSNVVAENPYTLINGHSLKKTFSGLMLSSAYKPYSFVDKCLYIGSSPNRVVDTQKADYKTRLVWFNLLDSVASKRHTNIKDVHTDSASLLRCYY